MIIDCHTHIDCKGTEFDPQNHFESCQQIDYAFVLASCEEKTDQANKKVAQYVSDNPKMVGFAVVNVLTEKLNLDQVKNLKEKGFKGLVVYCSENGFHPCHSRAKRLYQAAQELSLPVFFHNAAPLWKTAKFEFSQVWPLDEIAREFSELKIIIGNMGSPFTEQTIALLGKHENVYGDLTIDPEKIWKTYNTVVQAYEGEVMDKLIFGSGFPCNNASNCVETLLGFNKLLANSNLPNVPREQIRSIIERDSIKLLGIQL